MENKEYEVKGTVTISTEEYKDLVKSVFEAEKSSENYRDRYWKEQETTKSQAEQIKSLEKKLEFFQRFINSSEDINLEYKMYLKKPEVNVSTQYYEG